MHRISTPLPPSVIVRMTHRQVSHNQYDKSPSIRKIKKQKQKNNKVQLQPRGISLCVGCSYTNTQFAVPLRCVSRLIICYKMDNAFVFLFLLFNIKNNEKIKMTIGQMKELFWSY